MNTETTQSLGDTRRRIEAMNAKARQKELHAKHDRDFDRACQKYTDLKFRHGFRQISSNPFREIAAAMR